MPKELKTEQEPQEWERLWWGDCRWTLNEELKQLVYARKMGLGNAYQDAEGHWPVFDLMGRSVVDIGGGPSSLLLKCINVKNPLVMDPCEFPKWIYERYDECKIEVLAEPAEHDWLFDPHIKRGDKWEHGWDEAWIYNVLQHVEVPEEVVKTARRIAKRVRIFEWIETPPHTGHPHMLTSIGLDQWLGSKGFVEYMNESGCTGKAYYGVFDQ